MKSQTHTHLHTADEIIITSGTGHAEINYIFEVVVVVAILHR